MDMTTTLSQAYYFDVLGAIKHDTKCKGTCKVCYLTKHYRLLSCDLAIATIKDAKEGRV